DGTPLYDQQVLYEDSQECQPLDWNERVEVKDGELVELTFDEQRLQSR
ncbi:hypothetical protein JCM3765_000735, partial [Sporobolomyces pararoseus]